MRLAALLLAVALPGTAAADPAKIEGVAAVQRDDGWVISVTLRHTDTGWGDYADAWRVELVDGTVVAQRQIKHPHVTEQPFTRSQTGIVIPPGIDRVMIRAHTLTDGWGARRVELVLRGE